MNAMLPRVAAALLALHSLVSPGSTTPASEPSPAIAGSIVRAQFTSAIKDRQPTDSLTTGATDQANIYFFTELQGLSGSKVTHRWEHDGKVAREQTFDVGADRWRVWSNKTLGGHMAGEWKVTVVDGTGATLGTYTLAYGK